MTTAEAIDIIDNGGFDSIDEFRISVEIGGWQFYTEKSSRNTAVIILEDLPADTNIHSVEQYKAWMWEEIS